MIHHFKADHGRIGERNCDRRNCYASQAGALRHHLEAVHERLGDHGCHQCNYFTSTACNSRNHLIVVHEKIKEHKCDQCNCSTNREWILKPVQAVHEKIEEYISTNVIITEVKQVL